MNVTSTAGIAAPPLGGYYAATKFALEALSEALSMEVGHFGVKVIVIEPGFIETQFGANVLDHRGEPGPYEELARIGKARSRRSTAARRPPAPSWSRR